MTENTSDSCVWHDGQCFTSPSLSNFPASSTERLLGYLEPTGMTERLLYDLGLDGNGEFPADHDGRCHGTVDIEAMRKEFPDGFMWDCCDGWADAEGCQVTRHSE